MMEFKKYNGIENSYRQKYIDKFTDILGQDWKKDLVFVAREKLDGANIQLVFSPNEPFKVGKRTSYLDENDKFFDIWNTLADYPLELSGLQCYADNNNVTIRIFGEIYGPGINGRVNYGSQKKIAIFDMYKISQDGTELLLTQQEFEIFAFNICIEHLLCPLIGYYDTLEEALAVDVENIRKAGTDGSEGIIIQPANKVIRMYNGERFILKKKSQKFEDKRVDDINKGQKAEPKEKDIIYSLNQEFKKYITKNRVLDTFAKYGQIEKPSQIGEYIGYVMEDAKIDFLKDNDVTTIVPNMDKKQEKNLYNVGSMVVNILKDYL